MASIRNYNAFLKAVRSKHDLSLKEARAAYKVASQRLGRPARGVDVARRPNITRDAAKQAPREVAKAAQAKRTEIARVQQIAERVRKDKPERPGKKFESLSEYLDWFMDAEDYEYEEVDATTDYPAE